MKILVIGDSFRFDECRQKLGDHEYGHLSSHSGLEKVLPVHDVIFDFLIHQHPDAFKDYGTGTAIVFVNTCYITLARLARNHRQQRATIFGFNGFPTLFNREFLEVSILNSADAAILENVCGKLKTKYLQVDDRVGMVTPRVICMIINEAYNTVQEGTATREDIDLAMRLGTKYPYGPFEWCSRIGLQDVYELLEAVYDDTKDERYKISALMRQEYLTRH
jgi:3-hydroxybutyryl-CoA dehydrogenase